MLQTGVDILEIERWKSVKNRHGERFLARIYTAEEIEDCAGKAASLAARFAAKEAVAKALGTGIGAVGWLDIEIRLDDNGRPFVNLYHKAAEIAQDLGISQWALSLSHCVEYAVAFVVAMS